MLARLVKLRLAALLFTAFAAFSASQSKAAIFRVQGATTGSEGSFVAGGNPFTVSGEFRVLTNYLNADGTQSPQNGDTLQAWNLIVKDGSGTMLARLVNGYSDAAMGGYTDNSARTSSPDTDSFAIECNTSSQGCVQPSDAPVYTDSLVFIFGQNFNDIIGNSYDANGTDRSAPVVNPSGIAFRGSIASSATVQADFVPLQVSSAAFVPAFLLFKRMKRRAL